jgi:hypothetical protein
LKESSQVTITVSLQHPARHQSTYGAVQFLIMLPSSTPESSLESKCASAAPLCYIDVYSEPDMPRGSAPPPGETRDQWIEAAPKYPLHFVLGCGSRQDLKMALAGESLRRYREQVYANKYANQ